MVVFQPPGGSHNLWDLVAVIKGQDDSLLPQNYGQGIMHMKHLVRFKTVSDNWITNDKLCALLLFLLHICQHTLAHIRIR